MTPFPDITLTDRQSAVFEMLVDGLPLETIAARINCAPKTLAANVLPRLSRVLRAGLNGEVTTVYHLIAAEFLRRQSAILAGQFTPPRIEAADSDDADAAIEAAGIRFYPVERAKAATA